MAWRLVNVKVRLDQDPGKDDVAPSAALAQRVGRIMQASKPIPLAALTVLRKSFDPRPDAAAEGSPHFMYIVLVDHAAAKAAGASLQHRPGKQERLSPTEFAIASKKRGVTLLDMLPSPLPPLPAPSVASGDPAPPTVIIGAGPAGLFAALTLARAGRAVTLLERGEPVERRGRDIGALFARRKLDPESNLCFGEGGAGTWSDGKLTTKIGKNEAAVRAVLNTLVEFGAPESVLVSGKPHIGTDRLVHILKGFRAHLLGLGAAVRFGARVNAIKIDHGTVCGVELETGEVLAASNVVLAPGHSARDMYEHLVSLGVKLQAKPFAMGLRIEHPQAVIDEAQFGDNVASWVERGRGKVPVADYKLSRSVTIENADGYEELAEAVAAAPCNAAPGAELAACSKGPPATSRRQVYSFCMCPGGQIVPTATEEGLLCVNGMSFSRRNSKWANSALVVNVTEADWAPYVEEHGPLAGAELQRVIERRAAAMAPTPLTSPAQRALDFLSSSPSSSLPPSSYRLGTAPAPLHTLFPPAMTLALRGALRWFDSRMDGFLHEDAVLHAVETRTSAPVTIVRNSACEAAGLQGLYPCGEGAGYAGGIVSAAVDGVRVATSIVASGDMIGSRATAHGAENVAAAEDDKMPPKEHFMY